MSGGMYSALFGYCGGGDIQELTVYSMDAVADIVGDRWVDCLTSSDGMLDFLVRIICCLPPRRPRIGGPPDCW